eukprot:gene25856-biopygen22517
MCKACKEGSDLGTFTPEDTAGVPNGNIHHVMFQNIPQGVSGKSGGVRSNAEQYAVTRSLRESTEQRSSTENTE